MGSAGYSQNMLGKEVKREMPDSKPANSVSVKTKVKLRAIRSLGG